jgi:hypothetical protein
LGSRTFVANISERRKWTCVSRISLVIMFISVSLNAFQFHRLIPLASSVITTKENQDLFLLRYRKYHVRDKDSWFEHNFFFCVVYFSKQLIHNG